MKKFILPALVLVLLAGLPAIIPIAASASTITGALYQGIVRFTNSSTVASNVCGAFTLGVADLIAAGHLNATATNIVARDDTGNDLPIMVGYGGNPSVIFYSTVPANSNRNAYIYTGNVTGGKLVYSPGTAGGTIPDTMTEPGSAFEWDFTNCLLTPSSSAGIEDAFQGADATSLASHTLDSGGTWTVSVAGTSKAEIDTAQYYTGLGGTSSAYFYRDGTNHPVAYTGLSALSSQSISLMIRKDNTSAFAMQHGNGTKLITVGLSSAEVVQFLNSAGSWESTGISVIINTWYLLEIKNVSWTAGTYDIYLNSIVIKSGATMYANTGIANTLYFTNTEGTSEAWIDNLKITYTDTDRALISKYTAATGGYKAIESPVTGGKYLAQVIVPTATDSASIRPSAAGTNTNLTPSAGTNWSCSGDNNDATYVTTNSATYVMDTYNMPDQGYMVSINSVTAYFRIRAFAGGITVYGKPVWRIGTTNYEGTEQSALSTSPVTKSQVYTTSPATGIAWTTAELNAAEFGVELKTSAVGNDVASVDVWYVINYNTYAITQAAITGITAVEYDGVFSLAGGTMTLTLGSTTGNVAVAGSVPNNTAVTTALCGTTVLYCESWTYKQSGSTIDTWGPQYAPTYTGTVTHNIFTPSVRTTTSDPDVTVSLISYKPINQAVPDQSVINDWPTMVTSVPEEPETMYDEETLPGIFFAPLVHAIWPSSIPEAMFWYGFAFFFIITGGILVFYLMAEKGQSALLLKDIAMTAIMIFWALPGPNIYGMYVVIYFVFWCFGTLVLSRNYGW